MEELQDAIEDAQYMKAMHDPTPRPTKHWHKLSPEELAAFKCKLLEDNPLALTAESICSSNLGLYMFSKYVQERGYAVLFAFIMEVAVFRSNTSFVAMDLARKIAADFLVCDSSGPQESIDYPGDLLRVVPALASNNSTADAVSWRDFMFIIGDGEEISVTEEPVTRSIETEEFTHLELLQNESPEDQFGHCAIVHDNRYQLCGSMAGPEILPTFRSGRLNAISVRGPPLEKVLEALESNSELVSRTLFDELDCIVFSFLADLLFDDFLNSRYFAKYLNFRALGHRPVSQDDFVLFRVLGRGGFGLVSACKSCFSGKLFAVKVMSKKRIKYKKVVSLVRNERNILSSVESPFVVCLKYAFTAPNDLFLVLDLMIGGDLGYQLQHYGHFPIGAAKFYAARTLMGIAALHDLSIVYRDLKPENILMDEYGYTKISDLGLASYVGKKGISGLCGTRGYWAPEMLDYKIEDGKKKRGMYNLSVDWFSFGCCVYEFIAGVSPFRTVEARQWGGLPLDTKEDRDRVLDKATLEMDPVFDDKFDNVSKDLLRKLLNKDGHVRLGAKGYQEIMSHPWFADIDFARLSLMPAPIVPGRNINIASQSDIGCFRDSAEVKKVKLVPEDHVRYNDWGFVSQRAFESEVVEFLKHEERMGSIRPESQYPINGCCVLA